MPPEPTGNRPGQGFHTDGKASAPAHEQPTHDETWWGGGNGNPERLASA